MTRDPQKLTDKERQTLRLLTLGHDAKSIARELGLSVHTINERLRDARRKMGASSSREAARLLRDQDAADSRFSGPQDPHPQNCGPELFGDAASSLGAASSVHQTGGAIDRRRPRWIAGAIAMPFALVAVALATLAGQPPAPPAPTEAAADRIEVRAAREWLALLDADDWEATWNGTGQSFKTMNTVAIWTKASEDVRASVGKAQGRQLISVEELPAPPYGYTVVKFRANYTKRPNAVEKVSLVRENDSWRIAGIIIE